jgi:anti-sigma28 factor (negative regulator of flagellin synthesis)
MRIHQQQTSSIAADRSERAGLTGRLGPDSDISGTRSRQVGLDRVDVSRVGEAAASLVETTMQQREERVAVLAAKFQSGSYNFNLASLTQAILEHDTDTDPAYAD